MNKMFLLLLFLTLCLFGCSGRNRVSAAEPPSAAEGSANTDSTNAAAPAPDRKITLSPPTQTATSAPSVRPVVRESRSVQQKDQLLSIRQGSVYSPEDFEIGALQGFSGDRNVQLVLRRIRLFREGLQNGKVPLDDVHPDWLPSAQRSLEFHLDRGNIPLDIRVGIVDIYISGKARANVRLIGNPGVAFGEIYLEKLQDKWLVTDFQIDLADLGENSDVRGELYEPSVYRMMNLP
jgi:hypothetical protein